MSQQDVAAIHSFLGKHPRSESTEGTANPNAMPANDATKRSRPMNVPLTMGEFHDWEVTSQYDIVSKLGRGSYGEVVKAKNRITEAVVAIKQMKNVFDDPIDATRAYREIHILRKLRHPAIVDFPT
eukprot:gene18368-22061_t